MSAVRIHFLFRANENFRDSSVLDVTMNQSVLRLTFKREITRTANQHEGGPL